MLITDADSRIGVLLDASREIGILTGSPQGTCRVIYLSLDGSMDEGEKVLTAGFGASFPKGLPVGRVKAVETEKTNLYKYAVVETFADLNKIEEVICIKTE